MVEEEEFVGTGEVVRIEKTEEVIMPSFHFHDLQIVALDHHHIQTSVRFRTIPSVMKTL